MADNTRVIRSTLYIVLRPGKTVSRDMAPRAVAGAGRVRSDWVGSAAGPERTRTGRGQPGGDTGRETPAAAASAGTSVTETSRQHHTQQAFR